jgi:hypothetical protein
MTAVNQGLNYSTQKRNAESTLVRDWKATLKQNRSISPRKDELLKKQKSK